MREKLTAVFQKSQYGYIGYIEEIPGANTQGLTLEETKRNLIEAVQLVLECNRQIAEKEISGKDVIKEQLGNVILSDCMEITIASEMSLKKDWLNVEEDEAWQNL
ncbi:Uncharacterized protein family UPF0150 domain protein [Candidatus Magnetoovum chiemensis]|nr:Uncharacterized protein family UPF0150 domain protein [Candidatus Magnetoovum chiemensis]